MGATHAWVVMLAACGPTMAMPTSDQPAESFDPSVVPTMRLQQTLDSTIGPNLSLACADNLGTKENAWYRVFSLHDAGIDSVFEVNRVNFGVQNAIGEQRVQVSVGTYAGDLGAPALDLSKIEMFGMVALDVPQTSTGETLQANYASVRIPAGMNVVVEIHSPAKDRTFFYPGATAAAETASGYLQAAACGAADPTTTSVLGHPETHLLMAVSGSY